MKLYTRLWVFAFALILTPLSQASDKLFLLTENYPPFNMSIDDRNFARESGIDGVSTDIVREMMKRAQIKYSMTLRSPWNRIYDMTLKKDNYALFSTTYTEERKPLFKWVGPLVGNDWVIFKKPGSSIKISSLEDLKKYKVGGYKGDATAKYLQSKGINIIETALDKHNAEKLAAGRIDLWASSRFSAPYVAETAGVEIPSAIYTFNSVDLYLALNPGIANSTVRRLQTVLDSMKQDGSYDSLVSNYL